jgi:hypothetical protein
MRTYQLNELVRLITRKVLKEFVNIDPATKSIEKMNSDGDTEPDTPSDMDDAANKRDLKHNAEQGLKNNEFKRKAAEQEYKRNQDMVNKYRQVDKPMLKKERDALKQQVHQI